MNNSLLNVFKALSDDTRVEMVQYLLQKNEWSCHELSKKFSLSQPALSHHFGKLVNAGIIKERKNGKQNFYSIDKKFLKTNGLDIHKIIKSSDKQ